MTDRSFSDSPEPQDADLDRRRRQFQLASQQIAAHSLDRYLEVCRMFPAMRREHGERP